MVATRSRKIERVVLVVDDDATIRDLLEEVISARGHEVVTVGSGEEAVKQVKKRHFHLIFLDWSLPGMSGAEALIAIKAEDERAVVVVITGYRDNHMTLVTISLGARLLISKPFQIKDIVEVLNMVNEGERLNGESHNG